MLKKIFFLGSEKNPNKIASNQFHAGPLKSSSGPFTGASRAVKIVYPGGRSEKFYMAIPAARVIEKNPSFILARPEIFHRPWDNIVMPDEFLIPGQKYFLVPRQTVKKLRRRIKRTVMKLLPDSSISHQSNSFSTTGILVKPGLRIKAPNRHVRFFGIDNTNESDYSSSVCVTSHDKKNGKKELVTGLKKGPVIQELVTGSKNGPVIRSIDGKNKRIRNENAWEPSLDVIIERIT